MKEAEGNRRSGEKRWKKGKRRGRSGEGERGESRRIKERGGEVKRVRGQMRGRLKR